MTAANYYISRFYHLAKRFGLDADGLLQAADIGLETIDVPGSRVSAEKLAVVLVGIWDALEDEAMSLSGSKIPRGSFVHDGKLTVHETDLRGAINQFIRFYSMVTNTYSMSIRIEGSKAQLTFEMNYPDVDDEHSPAKST
ncbi:MAG: AraC family transcriptional regulator ligand-binding domain-containing protein [Woeseiaceae bacterium]|nr:AraC family transcriptional regulator ligand-binding domain-containing protein [Woeseiaceae bacterium]